MKMKAVVVLQHLPIAKDYVETQMHKRPHSTEETVWSAVPALDFHLLLNACICMEDRGNRTSYDYEKIAANLDVALGRDLHTAKARKLMGHRYLSDKDIKRRLDQFEANGFVPLDLRDTFEAAYEVERARPHRAPKRRLRLVRTATAA